MNNKLEIKFNHFVNAMRIVFRYYLFKLLRRQLHLEFISSPDPIIIYGNPINIFWQVRGCYKITINDEAELSGNNDQVHLNSTEVTEIITIKFYGVSSIIEKTFSVVPRKVELKQDVSLDTNTKKFAFSLHALLDSKQKLFSVSYLNSNRFKVPNISDLRPLISCSLAKKMFSAKINLKDPNPNSLKQPL
jgi:hypothetical protein